ncbi:MAG: hypothetical protein IT350_15315 [Deltaproteobacteria bacterium]|nr:hypothetical protein [Deltaproteobacteria bacterium]
MLIEQREVVAPQTWRGGHLPKCASDRVIVKPVICVMSAGVTDETSSPIVFFNVPLTDELREDRP